jgi:hypothetical protein
VSILWAVRCVASRQSSLSFGLLAKAEARPEFVDALRATSRTYEAMAMHAGGAAASDLAVLAHPLRAVIGLLRAVPHTNTSRRYRQRPKSHRRMPLFLSSQ